MIKNITLLGTTQTCNRARCLLENHPSIRRVDVRNGNTQLKLLFSDFASNLSILMFLKDSGIDGIIFER